MEYHLYHVLNIIFLSIIATGADELDETSCSHNKTSKVVCQENELIINCQNGLVLNFANAKFGKNEISHCPQYLGTETLNCNREKETLDVLNNYCSNQSSCDLKVTKERFGSPPECWGITKYLEVTFWCLPLKCQALLVNQTSTQSTSHDYNRTDDAISTIEFEGTFNRTDGTNFTTAMPALLVNQTSTQSTSHDYNRTDDAISTIEFEGTFYRTNGTNFTTAMPGKWTITTDFQSPIFDSTKPFTDDSLIGIVCGGVAGFLIIIVLVVIIWKCRRKIKHSNVEKTDRNPTDIRGHQYDNSAAHIQTSVTDLIGDKVKNQAIEMHPIDMSRNAVVNDLDNDVTENIYDISGAGERNSLLMTGEADDDTYDLTNQGEKVGEEHYDVHVTDDTYDVSSRCNRRNNAVNYVDDTYDHFIQGNDLN